MEIGTLSYLRALEGEEEGDMGRIGDGSNDEGTDNGGAEDYWMKAGEREKKRVETIAEEKDRVNTRIAAVKDARVQTLQLVKHFISMGIPISDLFGSDLINSFLLLSGELLFLFFRLLVLFFGLAHGWY